jgi:pyridoxal phosphate enzyme (YggS family)
MEVTVLAERVEQVRQRIRDACGRAGREPDSVQLVAVTKKVPPAVVREAAECGLTVFGENRVQEARQKIPLCPSGLEWHMIGHLQRNKAAEAARYFSMVHSVDSVRLLEALNSACDRQGVVMPVCLEVNVSGEGSKYGLQPGETAAALEQAGGCMSLDVVGLMTIPPFDPEPETARPFFRQLRELRDRLRAETGWELPELSMGMTNDFEVAIEEGATRVRVGSALFGSREG